MEILDIHTHRFYDNPAISIMNCFPGDFTPLPGRYYSVGFHPWYLSNDESEDWSLFEKQVTLPQVVAIGETGLDKLSSTEIPVQETAFEKQADIASKVRKPLIIHCVKAFNEIIRYKMQLKPDVPWIIHGFRGKKEMAEELVGHGFYLSFGEKYQEDALRVIPPEKMLMETDESNINIHDLYKKAAFCLSLSLTDFTKHIQENIRDVFFHS